MKWNFSEPHYLSNYNQFKLVTLELSRWLIKLDERDKRKKRIFGICEEIK